MCRFKSMILLKDRVFIPDYDSHDKMLDELGIEDNRKNAERLFVRVELSPADGDVFSDISTWEFKADQDILPEWYVKEVDRERAVKAVKEWAENHIYIGENNLELSGGGHYYIKDCKNVDVRDSATVKAWDSATVKAWDSATVKAWDSATVKACGSATVEAWDSATVKAWDSATVEAWDSATVKAWDSATVKAWDSATVEAWDSATVKAWDSATVKACGSATVFNSLYASWKNKDTIILSDNATFKDNYTKTIYQSGDWKVVLVDKK